MDSFVYGVLVDGRHPLGTTDPKRVEEELVRIGVEHAGLFVQQVRGWRSIAIYEHDPIDHEVDVPSGAKDSRRTTEMVFSD